jgi:hypothetical protein
MLHKPLILGAIFYAYRYREEVSKGGAKHRNADITKTYGG